MFDSDDYSDEELTMLCDDKILYSQIFKEMSDEQLEFFYEREKEMIPDMIKDSIEAQSYCDSFNEIKYREKLKLEQLKKNRIKKLEKLWLEQKLLRT